MVRKLYWLSLVLFLFASAGTPMVRGEQGVEAAPSSPDQTTPIVSPEEWESMLISMPDHATRTRHYYHLATATQSSGAAVSGAVAQSNIAGEGMLLRPVYENTPPVQGIRVLAPGIGFQIADDITTVAVGGCDLLGFEFIVGGGGDGTGPGFGVEFAVYDDCPGAGGQPIPGATGELTFDNDGLQLVLIDLTESPVAVPKRYWVAMEFSTNTSGWLAGTTASIGFTTNNFHHPFFPCAARFPGQNFYAGFSYVAHCGPTEREFLAYLNTNAFGPRLALDTTRWIVDDVQLIGGIEGGQCTLTSYDVAAVGRGTPAVPIPFTITAELRATCSPAFAIPGTQATFEAVGDGLPEIAQFELEEPVPLPPGQNFFIAFRYSDPAQAIVASATPTLGFTNPNFTFEDGILGPDTTCDDVPCQQCQFTAFDGVGFLANIRCLGDPPIGSCCDLAVQSPAGDDPESALCRNVPEIACQGVLTRFEPSPARCPGTCTDDETRCDMDVDCPEGETCDLSTPFDPPCGHSACCKPPFPTPGDEGCEDLPKADCLALFDEDGNQAIWQTAQVCNEGQQDCVRWICRFAEGNCDESHPTPGCNNARCCDQVCDSDSFCCLFEWDSTCVGAATGDTGNATDACSGISSNDDCFSDRECSDDSGPCASDASCNQCAVSGNPCLNDDDCKSCTNTGAPCIEDADCEGGACVPSGESCFISGATCVESFSGARFLNTCSGTCNDPVRPCLNDLDCRHCSVNKEIFCENDEDCPPLQECITEFVFCDLDNPRTVCEFDSDCDEAGEVCIANTSPFGTIMDVETGSTSIDEGFCCNRTGPGNLAFNGVWGKFVATETSAEISTCPTNTPMGTDSIIEVYRSVFDKECSNTGEPCFDAQDCEVQGEPTGTCDPSDRAACQTREPIACNDNINEPCGGRPNNSRLCLDGLTIGETYLVQVAAATSTTVDSYQLRLRSPCPGGIPTPPLNDHCEDATIILEGTEPFNLTDATMDCPYVGSGCLPPTSDLANPYTMTNDVWFDYFVTQNGLVTIETCEDNAENTPDTTLVVYSGFNCPVTEERIVAGGCNDDAGGECGAGSSVKFGVRVNESYRVRIGGKEGSEPSGNLTISVAPDCQQNGREDFLDIACGPDNSCRLCASTGQPCQGAADCPRQCRFTEGFCESNFDCPLNSCVDGVCTVSGAECGPGMNCQINSCNTGQCSGTLIAGSGDCNGNTRPDECDIEFLIATDCNENGRPDSCDIACGDGNLCGYCSINGTMCMIDDDCPEDQTCEGPFLAGSADSNTDGQPDECAPPECPDGAVTFHNQDGAADGDWYDARQPHELNDANALQGRSTFMVTAPAGADDPICWELCETDNNPALHAGLAPNSISAVNDIGGGMFEIVLNRPIAQGEVTRLTYTTNGATARFGYLPGDANMDETSAPADILGIIDCLNGVAGFPCELANTDTDRSGEAGPPDILRVIDLLNGASAFETWLDAALDDTGCP